MALLLAFIAMPVAGAISDRVGRKPVLVVGALLSAAIAVPAYMLASNGTAAGAIAGQALLGLALAVYFGPFGVAFVELFPVKNRFSGAGFGYNIAYVVFGGTAPYVSTWLVGATDNLLAPAFYMVVIAAAVGFICLALPKPQIDEDAISSAPGSESGPAAG